MNKKDRLHQLVRTRKQKPDYLPITGMVILNDSSPSSKSVRMIADKIIQLVIEPKNKAVVEKATRDVLDSPALR